MTVPGALFSVPHAAARAAFLAGLDAFLAAASQLDDDALLAASRCRGWTAGDVAVHVHLGLQEMLLGVVSLVDEPPDIDAATYWCSFPPAPDTHGHTRFVRLVASAYRSPSAALAHLRTTAGALARGVTALADGAVAFQGHVLYTGDFLATWAVELAVHHLDLDPTRDLDPAPAALHLARGTVEALAGAAAASDVPDVLVVLAGAGRIPPAEVPSLTSAMPVLG